MDMSMVNEVVWEQQSSDPQAYATDATSVLGAFVGANLDVVNSFNREFDKEKAEIVSLKEALEHLKKQHEDKKDELQLRNVTLSVELQRERNDNATLVQKVAVLERKNEDATANVASSSFSKFSQEEFKELAIRTNREHFDLVCELFITLADIFETHIVFTKMYVVMEDLIEKIWQASNAYDEVIDSQRYLKDKPNNITLLTNFQFKRARTTLRSWEDLDETVAETIKKRKLFAAGDGMQLTIS